MSTVNESSPPYLTFERLPVEDRAATQKNGHFSTRDVDYVTVTRPGSRDTFTQEVDVYFDALAVKVRKNEFPAQWLDQFRSAYKNWLDGEEAPTTGTPIKGWPVLSPAAQKDLIHAGIRSVEDLASLSDAELQNIAIGALNWKLKARTWLESAKSIGTVVEQMSTLQNQLQDLVALTKNQAAEISRLSALVPKPAPAPAQKAA